MTTETRDQRTEAEREFHRDINLWGSDAYPIMKAGRKWIWVERRGIRGTPVAYRTKREAFAAVERYIIVLCDKAAGRWVG